MLPMCTDMGVGCVPYSPLGKGRLARPWGQHTQRGDTDQVARTFDLDLDQSVVEAVQQVADERGVQMAQIAMAWVLSKPVVTAPIVGATKTHHLADAAAALEIQLTEEEISHLEEPYTTQPAYWW
jgi:aryl-alcohol dehydrogenase-like predicted oxidoreductase